MITNILGRASGAGMYVFLMNGQLEYIGQATDSILVELRQHKTAVIQHLAATTSFWWLVETSDRGSIKVSSYPPHTLAEILEAVPDAVSATPLTAD